MRKLALTALAVAMLAVPAVAAEKAMNDRQSAIMKVLEEHFDIMHAPSREQVRNLLADARKAAETGDTKQADRLLGQAMMIVTHELYFQGPGGG